MLEMYYEKPYPHMKPWTKRIPTPEVNPIGFDYSTMRERYTPTDEGKVYRFSDNIRNFYWRNRNIQGNFFVPKIYNRPTGFLGRCCTWYSPSELLAKEYFRKTGRAMHKLKRRWEAEFVKEDELFELSTKLTIEEGLDFELPTLKEGFTPRFFQTLPAYYQKVQGGNILIADEMRVGKTHAAVLISRMQEHKQILIVCPAMLQDNWTSAIQDMVIDPKIKRLEMGDTVEEGYNIISYDKVHSIKADVDLCIADEIHFILEKDARRSKGMGEIKAKQKLGLSGTPILNKTSDILGILKWLDFKLYEEFRVMINSMIDSGMETYDMTTEMTKHAKRNFMCIRNFKDVSPESEVFLNFIKVECRLPESATLQQVGESKIHYAVQYLKTFIDEKIIVTTQHLAMSRKLAMSLGSEAVVITGETPKGIRKQVQKAFKEGVRILIGSMAIAEGLDFSFSNRILVTETGYSYRMEQLRARANRVGKSEMVTVDVLVADHPKEARVLEVLGEKYEMNSGLRD
jgi:hypothetical protein